ncbi:hypothetical protein PG985_002515 [Apiospora marii]|uniref:uncharacterized protein n=1 Tax=Apiospora marii TaxID=335849 RepID=UPI00312D5DD7
MTEHKNADAGAPSEDLPATAQPIPYSAFTIWQKRWILFLAAFAAMFSPMSSFIFYPAITSMAESLHTTVGKIDLAITTYMVVSGVTPAILGGAADNMGRRPVYIVALAIYLAANIGLALQSNYTSLLVLRMVQSAGSSETDGLTVWWILGTISLGYGVINDIADPSERGLYVGIFNMGYTRGLVTSQLNWHWVFWVLAILGGFCLLLVIVSLPETARNIVGDGSIPAPGGLYRPLVHPIASKDDKAVVPPRRPRFVVPNPVSCLRLLFFKDIFIVLLCNGIYYATYCCVQATLASLFVEVYGYHELQAGLIYIPFGFGCLVATYSWGRLLNYDYARVKKLHDSRATETTTAGYHDEDFPIEEARLRSCFYLVGVVAVSTIAYGWVVGLRVFPHWVLTIPQHAAAPLVLQAIIGYSVTGIFGKHPWLTRTTQALGTLLTDLNPSQSSTAAASANIVRCSLAAASLAVIQLVIDAVGVGWCFTTVGLLSGCCGPLLLLEMKQGQKWRRQRKSNTPTQQSLME